MTQNQTWDPHRYARNAGFVAEFGKAVVGLLAPRPGERILDLGCGDGVLTQQLVDAGCEVVGVDASEDQIRAARERGLDVRVADGQALEFVSEFDAVFSNAALHWMKRPDAVIAGVYRGLKPVGRFVGEFGGAGNVAHVESELNAALARRGIDGESLNPWYFPTPEEYGEKLLSAGFHVDSIELIPRPTPLPGELIAWLETFAESFLAVVPGDDHPKFFREVQEALLDALCDEDGRWTVDYVRLRFAASKVS